MNYFILIKIKHMIFFYIVLFDRTKTNCLRNTRRMLLFSKELNLFGVFLYPRQEGCDARVDAGVLSLAAADAPRDDAHLRPATALVHHQRAAAVTLHIF